jgi:hypothetical protein
MSVDGSAILSGTAQRFFFRLGVAHLQPVGSFERFWYCPEISGSERENYSRLSLARPGRLRSSTAPLKKGPRSSAQALINIAVSIKKNYLPYLQLSHWRFPAIRPP